MKTRSTVTLLCALLTLSACEANTGPETDTDIGTFEAVSTGSFNLSLSGQAQSGPLQGGGFGVLMVGQDAGNQNVVQILLARSERPSVGNYEITGDIDTMSDFVGIARITNRSTGAASDFQLTTGTVNVIESTVGNVAGEFTFTGTGTAPTVGTAPEPITVSGKFNARS